VPLIDVGQSVEKMKEDVEAKKMVAGEDLLCLPCL